MSFVPGAKSQSFDTIYLRPPHAHLPTWYDSCPVFYDSNMRFCTSIMNANIGSNQFHHVITTNDAGGDILVNGLGCLVSIDWWSGCGARHLLTTDTVPSNGEYLYLYELIGDTSFHELKKVRWDTATPQVIKLPRNYDTATYGFDYCYYYEAMFDTFVPIQSIYAIGGSWTHDMLATNITTGCWPTFYKWIKLNYFMDFACNQNNDVHPRYVKYVLNDKDVNSTTECANDWSGWGPFFVLTNNFALHVSVDSSCLGMGQVRGGGNYIANTEHTILAVPETGYQFTHWSDGNTVNPRQVTVLSDTAIYAFFSPLASYQVNVEVFPYGGGSVLGAGLQFEGLDSLMAQPSEGYVFDHWDDGTTEPLRHFLLDHDTSFAAYFRKLDSFMVSVELVPPYAGVLEYGCEGIYEGGSRAFFKVKANPGWTFVQWDDSSHYASRSIVVESDTTLRAYFHNPEGICPTDNHRIPFTLTPNPARGRVVLACARDVDAYAVVSDPLGRVMARVEVRQGDAVISTTAMSAGLYFVSLMLGDGGTSVQRLVVE